jgi:hypothetical protein
MRTSDSVGLPFSSTRVFQPTWSGADDQVHVGRRHACGGQRNREQGADRNTGAG